MSALPEIDGVPLDDFMPCVMAREVRDGDWASHGASVPLAGAALYLAIETHAPQVDFWIQGCVNPANRNLREALTAPERIYTTTKAHMSQTAIIDFSLRGNSMFQFLRPLQIDPFCNVNVSIVPRSGKPPLRFHGIAVADAINAVRRTCLYVTEHSPRVLVQRLAFRTGAGHDDGSAWRESSALPPSAGPQSVITPLAVLRVDEGRRLRVASAHRGVTLDQVREATGFEIEAAPDFHETPMPTERELAALERVDPERIRRLEFRETRGEILALLAEHAGD